jgi:L-2-hydroxyglutarate oxidase
VQCDNRQLEGGVVQSFDTVVIGGGIVGMASARALLQGSRSSLVVLEAEKRLAAHQTGNNSGVIHSGLYYRPGSLKARNCVQGRLALERLCQERGVPFERCGKIVVATSEAQREILAQLEERGRANGLKRLRRLSAEQIREHEPHCRGVAGLHVGETGIVDYVRVTEIYAEDLLAMGGAVLTNSRVTGVSRHGNELVVETTAGAFGCRHLINCAGLQSDRIARMAGVVPDIRIVPFRGEYYELAPERRHLVRNLIYPVPDPGFPFLGVHFTRMINGGVEAGPNAVLALKREGYRRTSFSLRDTVSTLTYGGFWRLARRYLRTGLAEQWRSLSKRAFVRSLQELVPEVTGSDLRRAGAGVRAQALDRSGALVDDFRIVEDERSIHVLNAPSPAATASLAIAETIAALAIKRFSL